jgi:hypothetical protein
MCFSKNGGNKEVILCHFVYLFQKCGGRRAGGDNVDQEIHMGKSL